jgi:hypothetical protein
LALIKAKQIDIDDVAAAIMTRIPAVSGLQKQFWNLTNSVNSFTTTPSTAGPVINLVISAITGTTATVAWDAIPGAVTYDLQYFVQGDELTIDTITAINATTFGLTGLVAGTTYVVQVRANLS